MNNKNLLLIITAQSTLLLGILFTIWKNASQVFLINETYIICLGIFSTAVLIIALVNHLKNTPNFVDVRRTGVVKWFNSSKGFGFIEQEKGQDIFVHQSEIKQNGYRYLSIGDHVEFEIGRGKKGPIAIKVVRLSVSKNLNVPNKYRNMQEYHVRKYSEESREYPINNQVTETQLN